ncbi:glycoside hydrolase family 17 protein [Botryobasidium botryosum FD-172 SS1]|uniref:glucan endo-1,3-beta-D-glucosidase n=1 Tax=Botryobasidium botryosum (strain FD-172 SS1) TaxID=930990 RepID=A0A067N9G8_BOTB1|nr:glycoside hydrolase family 17 protein [Botryobasidium botryosum FD-172 SS1]
MTSFPSGCFPALGFTAPSGKPSTKLSDWWCKEDDEHGFLGFSYAVNACPSQAQMKSDFTRMRKDFNARYVRIYSACDTKGFYDQVVNAAYESNLGVFAMVWFGFDGGNEWKTRQSALLSTIETNSLAPYTIRSFDMGSETLFDHDVSVKELAQQIKNVKAAVEKYGIVVSTSDMQYSYVAPGNEGAPKDILSVVDQVHDHVLPFFDQDAKDGSNAWRSVLNSVDWFLQNTNNTKKIILTQTGWPSNTNVWKANSKTAVASVKSEQDYYSLIDSKCSELKKKGPRGGIGWFWQIYEDSMLDGWGILGDDGKPKFKFAPITSC